MVDLTVLIITKDEENNIQKCIESLAGIAKRIVVVDSYSNDRTCEIARSLGADVYQHEFENHAAQLNWGFCNTDIDTEWILRMDADEELTPELAEEIETKLDTLEAPVNGIILRRRIYFMGRWIRHGGVYPTYLLRIFRRGKGHCEFITMDEHLVLEEGNTVVFSHDLIDKNTKPLEWWISKHNWYSGKECSDYISKKVQMNAGNVKKNLFGNSAERKRWLKYVAYYKTPLFIRAHWYFVYRYYFRFGFLDGKEGKIFHFLQAYWYRFLVDAKIYEKTAVER
ncbi:MAG: glycosyltransferase family 2 protein [Lachnospiraceae bacterium]|nr:glycosyltransferase family 2 protein [Lachnospiraceae bacterium]